MRSTVNTVTKLFFLDFKKRHSRIFEEFSHMFCLFVLYLDFFEKKDTKGKKSEYLLHFWM